MTKTKYDEMTLNELRQYVLRNRENIEAFHKYIDRSKFEGKMTSLDLSNSEWEEKVKEAIRNSSNAIRWYCDRNHKNNNNVNKITNWWKNLHNHNLIKHHITGIEIDTGTGIWEPTQLNPPKEIVINNPQIEFRESTALLKYKSQDGSDSFIEAVAIDLDLNQHNLFVWSTNSAEVFIFSLEN